MLQCAFCRPLLAGSELSSAPNYAGTRVMERGVEMANEERSIEMFRLMSLASDVSCEVPVIKTPASCPA